MNDVLMNRKVLFALLAFLMFLLAACNNTPDQDLTKLGIVYKSPT